MKKALTKSSLREIRSTLSRFLSIFGIVAIGVGFFAGVKAAAPDMRNTVHDYVNRANLMDLRVVSTYGFNGNDTAAIREIAGAEVYPSYFTDVIAHYTDRSPAAARLISLGADVTDGRINALELTEGRMPEKENECLVNSAKMLGGPAVGSTVVFTDNFGKSPDDMISVNEYTIVGKVRSAMFIDKTVRGSTTVGNGSIESIYYIPEGNFCVEYNTEVYLRFPELAEYNCYGEEYKDLVDELSEELKKTGERRASERAAEIKDEARGKLSDAEKEVEDAEAEYNEKIADAEKKIADGEAEIAENEQKLIDGEAEIAENEQKLTDGEAEIAENEQKIADAEAEIADGEIKLADGEKEIAENERKLIDGEKEIAENRKKLEDGEKEIAENEKKLEDARRQYEKGLAEYNDGLKRYNDGAAAYERALAEYNDGRQKLDAALAEYNAGAAALEEGKKQLDVQEAQLEAAKSQAAAALGIPELTPEIMQMYAAASPDIAQLLAGQLAIDAARAEAAEKEGLLASSKAQLDAALLQSDEGAEQLAEGKAELDASEKQLADAKKQLEDAGKEIDEGTSGLEKAKAELEDGKAKLADAEAELADGRKKLEDGKKELAENRLKINDAKKEVEDGKRGIEDAKQQLAEGRQELADGKAELEDGRQKIEDGRREIEDGRKELEEKKAEGAEKIADAREKLADARKEIDDISEPKWYVFTRSDNPGFSEYGDNADRINNIAMVFPVFFIVVAMLVCLTTMSRMIEEERMVIGTLKALGYGNGSIMSKYMFYALSATVLGAVFGCGVGMYLFPFVIISAYGMMYDMPVMSITVDLPTALTACLVFTAAIALTVFFTSRSSLAEQAAQLMRPKAPKLGKRILLEYITPFWKRLGFSGKVTARNLFRYKRKMFMTIVGISGCTALLVTGFALHDAVNDILQKQFDDIQSYQGIFAFDRDEHPEAAEEAARIISDRGGSSIRVFQKMLTVNAGGRSVNAYIAVPSDPEGFLEFFDLRDRATGTRYSLTDESIYLDEKSSLLLGGIKAGDTIEIEKSETEKFSVTLTAPFENYPNHYIYMTENCYRNIFGESPEYNVLYFSHPLGTGDEQDKLGEELLRTEGALNVTFNSETMVTFSNMLDTLNSVIFVIIAAAGLLAFVVMYNLTNINITERIREIATLKVLGFYDGEVDGYVFRENILLSLLGTGAGLVLGVFLARFVITTAEVDIVMFGRNIYAMSYILAAVITMAFSVLVTVAMHRRLQRVNMIEALKSVE